MPEKDQDVKEVPIEEDAPAPLDPNDPEAKEAVHEEFEEAKEEIGGADDDAS